MRMQDKANQISAATVEILDRGSVVLASTPAAPRKATACEPAAREAAARETTADDPTDNALAAWAQHLASKLVDYCAVDLHVGVGRVVRLATAYRDRAQQAAIEQLATRSPVIVPIVAGGSTIGTLTLAGAAGVDVPLAEEVARRASLAVENARLRALLRDLTRSREEMLSIVSHDVRNPLGVVLTGSALLLRGSLPPDKGDRARRQVEAIQRAGHRINTLIRDLLDFASIEGGELALTARPHDVGGLLSEALDALRPIAAAKSQELAGMPPAQAMTVCCDRDRIVQVFANVVGNSMKFSPSGAHIRVDAVAEGPVVRFTVADDGPGMDPEELANLFDRSWQAQRKNRDGVGLGLAIVRGIVEAHGGRVSAESALGEGTRVHFTLASA
jgi:signal transduction histidine kinase